MMSCFWFSLYRTRVGVGALYFSKAHVHDPSEGYTAKDYTIER
jgi:hypothetical protein